MNKRTVLIIAALATPLVALTVLAQATTPKPKDSAAKAGDPAAMNPADASRAGIAASQSTPPLKPPAPPARSLSEAREKVKKRLAELEAMSEEDWEAEQRAKAGSKGPKLPSLEPVQRMDDPTPPKAQAPKE